MFSAVIERLSGKAALQEQYTILETQCERFRTALEQEKQQHQELSRLFVQRGNEHSRVLFKVEQEKATLIAERDEWQRQNTALQEHLEMLAPRLTEIEIDISANFATVRTEYSAAMSLLAELYEARIKKGSVKGWDMRYLALRAQHDQLAPVEAVEAKEE